MKSFMILFRVTAIFAIMTLVIFMTACGGNNPKPPETVATPAATPAGGSYTAAQTVTLASATTGADIHYTLDGTAPTTDSDKYSSPITISETKTLKAFAVKSGMDIAPY